MHRHATGIDNGMVREMSTKYNEECICPHCGGTVLGNLCGDKVIFWCDKCGGNSPDSPPSVGITLQEGRGKELRERLDISNLSDDLICREEQR